jgi:glycosyltransferase involved in cell wall biosynthesis
LLLKILITIPWFTPAFKAGGPVQSINNLVAALNEGYTFYIFCSNNDLHGLPLHITQTDSWTTYNAYTQVWYAGKADRSKNLVEQVEKIKPDHIFVIGLFDWHFNLVPLFFCKGVKKILSARGMLHPGALGQKAGKKKLFLQLMKWLQLQKRIAFHATDATEAGYVISQFGEKSEVFQAGNFPRRVKPSQSPAKIKGDLTLVSIGIISPMKNTLPVLQALAHCKEVIRYDIYGPVKDTMYWEDCLQQIKLLPENIEVNYHKEITPAEVPGKLYSGHIFIMPSRSENFGHAIYEALHAGLPVITSHHTPWNDLEPQSAGLNVETVPNAISKAISFFAGMDQQQLQHWKDGAVSYAEGAVNEEELRIQYERMFGGSCE